ncbi:MAG: GtrA family protein [Acidimicrobiales bacterium]|nr:GtrA family protein [Acidimicrobiales bacterium]
MSSRSKLNQLWAEHGLKFMRYCGVSVFNVVLGQSLLLFFFKVVGMRAMTANLAAIAVGTIPSYYLARRFVWAKTGRHSLTREVLPFWGLNGVGTLLSTLSVHAAESATGGNFIAVQSASIGAWLVVWVVKYLLLDRAIFRHQTKQAAAAETAPAAA